MYIAVDFDGTCVRHKFPDVGIDADGSVAALQTLAKAGHKLILFTMRAHPDDVQSNPEIAKLGFIPTSKDTLQDAIDWFDKNNIPLYGINDNPSQHVWTKSNKVYAQIYIDDAALGCPLKYPDFPESDNDRPFVNWDTVMRYMLDYKIITKDLYKEFLKNRKFF